METRFNIRYQTTVKAPATEVWKALTQPEIVKQYFFGTNLKTSWEPGSSIVFEGEWEGQSYQDKGIVLEYIHNQKLSFSYFSSFSGKEDAPENYLRVAYAVEPQAKECLLTIEQSNYTEELAAHSKANWEELMEALKKIVEV